jgi:hypothetical protein
LGYFAGKWFIMLGLRWYCAYKALILFGLWIKYRKSVTYWSGFRINCGYFVASFIIESWVGSMGHML